jgi:hypothetical protein
MRRGVLLLLLAGVRGQGLITDQSQLPTFPYPGICAISNAPSTPYNAFVGMSVAHNVSFDASSGWSLTTYELCDPATNVQKCSQNQYHLEAVRITNDGPDAPQCQTCPYHVDRWWRANSPISGTGEFNPMFGPCFDGQPSLQTACLQHPALFPVAFVGRYHYALQRPFPAAVSGNSLYQASYLDAITIHQFLSSGSSSSDPYLNGNALPPTDYGLGRGAVTTSLNSIQFLNVTSGKVDQATTNAFLRPFQTVNGVEQWIKWAQFWCNPSCHKDARYTQVGWLVFRTRAHPC